MNKITLGQLQFGPKSKHKAGEGLAFGKYKFFTSSDTQSKFLDSFDYEGPALIFGTGGKASVHYCEEKFATSTDCYILTTDDKNIFLKYIYSYLRGNMYLLEEGFKGAGLEHISKDYLKQISIPLPPLATQRAIADKLDSLQSLIDLKKQAITKTDELVKSIFLEMFGDPMKNEKGREVIDFGECIDVLTDYHANGSYEILRDKTKLLDIPDYAYMIRTTDLEHNNFTEGVKYITKEAYEFLSKSKVFGGEILITKIGSAGSIHFMPYLNRPISLGMNLFMIRTNEKLNNIFAYNYLQTPYCEKIIAGKINGAVTKTITKNEVRTIPFILPPLPLQQKFADIITQIEAQKYEHKLALAKLEELYQAEMQESFSL